MQKMLKTKDFYLTPPLDQNVCFAYPTAFSWNRASSQSAQDTVQYKKLFRFCMIRRYKTTYLIHFSDGTQSKFRSSAPGDNLIKLCFILYSCPCQSNICR